MMKFFFNAIFLFFFILFASFQEFIIFDEEILLFFCFLSFFMFAYLFMSSSIVSTLESRSSAFETDLHRSLVLEHQNLQTQMAFSFDFGGLFHLKKFLCFAHLGKTALFCNWDVLFFENWSQNNNDLKFLEIFAGSNSHKFLKRFEFYIDSPLFLVLCWFHKSEITLVD